MEEGNVKYKYPLPQKSESLNTFFIDELIVNETCYRSSITEQNNDYIFSDEKIDTNCPHLINCFETKL